MPAHISVTVSVSVEHHLIINIYSRQCYTQNVSFMFWSDFWSDFWLIVLLVLMVFMIIP